MKDCLHDQLGLFILLGITLSNLPWLFLFQFFSGMSLFYFFRGNHRLQIKLLQFLGCNHLLRKLGGDGVLALGVIKDCGAIMIIVLLLHDFAGFRCIGFRFSRFFGKGMIQYWF